MTDFDELAERFQSADGAPLVDYVGLALPFYRLQIDSLVSEKRALMPVEEYVLKVINQSSKAVEEVLGLLGLSSSYGRSLIARMIRDEFIIQEGSHLLLRPKGKITLDEDGQRKIYQKTISLLWNPISLSVVRGRLELLSSADVKAESLIKVIPSTARVPTLTEIPLDGNSGSSDIDDDEQIIRHLSFRRRTLMYRRGLLLLYGAGKGREPFARVAIDGMIDGAYSATFVQQGLLTRLGVDSQFSRRMGAIAVEQRVRPLGATSADLSLGDLLRQRSTLQLGIAGLERQADAAAAKKIDEKRVQLSDIQRRLESFPVRPMLPFEMPRMFEYALQKARSKIVITTTLPVAGRLTPIRFLLLEQALKNRVHVRILLSDRPKADEFASQHGPVRLLARLNELMDRHETLEVAFLRDLDRVVFEVSLDDVLIAVSNDPPLGLRSREPLAREFSGYVLAGKKIVTSYETQFMGAQSLSSVERVRITPRTKKSSPKDSGKRGRPLR
jgi:hypothetical protein